MSSQKNSHIYKTLEHALGQQSEYVIALSRTYSMRPFDVEFDRKTFHVPDHLLEDIQDFETKHYPLTPLGEKCLFEVTQMLSLQVSKCLEAVRGEAGTKWWSHRDQLPWIDGDNSIVATKWCVASRPAVSIRLSIWPEAIGAHGTHPEWYSTEKTSDHPHLRVAGTGKMVNTHVVSEGIKDSTVAISHLLYEALAKHDVFASMSHDNAVHTFDRHTGYHKFESPILLRTRSQSAQDHLEETEQWRLNLVPGLSVADSKAGNIVVEEVRAMLDLAVQDVKEAVQGDGKGKISFVYQSNNSDLQIELHPSIAFFGGKGEFYMQLRNPPSWRREAGVDYRKIVKMPSLA